MVQKPRKRQEDPAATPKAKAAPKANAVKAAKAAPKPKGAKPTQAAKPAKAVPQVESTSTRKGAGPAKGVSRTINPISSLMARPWTAGAGRPAPPIASRQETELLDRINVGLSEAQARRFRELDALRVQERLTADELAEFRALTEVAERIRVGQFKAIVELARLRGVSVPDLMARFGLRSRE